MPTRFMLMLCGPNGAGKSTLRESLRHTVKEFSDKPVIDPDQLAREKGLSPIAAGKEAANLARGYIASGTSFARESTMTVKLEPNAEIILSGILGEDAPEYLS